MDPIVVETTCIESARADVLGHPTRRHLMQIIETNQGICEADLRRRVQISRGTTKYHLMQLLQAGLVVRRSHGRTTHYFCPDVDRADLQDAVAGAQGETRRKILFLIDQQPDITASTISRNLGLTPRAVRWHLARLKGRGLILRDPLQPDHLYLQPALQAVLRGDPDVLPGGNLPVHLKGTAAFRRHLGRPWHAREMRDARAAPGAAI